MTPDVQAALAELRLAAADEYIAGKYPIAAAQLRRLAAPIEDPDPRVFRRIVLQRIRRTHLFGMSRRAAALSIAASWHTWAQSGGEDGLPDSIAAAFARLHRAGVAPKAYRTISDDLDTELHPD